VLLYVQNSINSCCFTEPGVFKSESVWCKLLLDHDQEICVGVCYKSPSAEDTEVQQLFSAVKCVSNKQSLIMGDFNYPNIDWDTLDSDSNGSAFLDLIQDCFLIQHVSEPTRGGNILDLVFTSEDNMVENLKAREHFSSSDHNIVAWNHNCRTVINKDDRVR